MKPTNPQPAKGKMPKAQYLPATKCPGLPRGVFIPLPTKQSRALAKFANLTDEQKVEEFSKELPQVDLGSSCKENWQPDHATARAALQRIGLTGGGSK